MSEPQLTHLNSAGEAHMVDVSAKAVSSRSAEAVAAVIMAPATLMLLRDGALPKGDVLATARIAGIMAAKKTSELIPLCHPLALTKVTVELTLDEALPGVRIRALCRVNGQTGVEMEALTAASVAALTLYDMCKAVQKDICITDIELLSKSGGKSGDYRREGA